MYSLSRAKEVVAGVNEIKEIVSGIELNGKSFKVFVMELQSLGLDIRVFNKVKVEIVL